ncbi:hypothetical protein ACFLSQ_05635, partial [Bacteroidota bacterium]
MPVLHLNTEAVPVNSLVNLGPVRGNYELMLLNDFVGVSDIQVASFFGSDVMRSGIDVNNAIVSHFSQSVAYSMNETERFGVELGYTEYSYDDKAIVNVNENSGSTSGIESNESGYDFSFSYPHPITIKNNKQMLWASAFYENTFYKTNGLSLVGRLGAGGSSEGPLGYGRV